jgi:hypothetical protein
MKLLVNSGSTKADWIAIDDTGKSTVLPQNFRFKPEVLNKDS